MPADRIVHVLVPNPRQSWVQFSSKAYPLLKTKSRALQVALSDCHAALPVLVFSSLGIFFVLQCIPALT